MQHNLTNTKRLLAVIMGLLFSRLTQLLEVWGTSHSRILMVGLDAAGKTTILYKLKLNETVTTIPTIGFNVEEVQFKGLSFTVWDIGGQAKIRELWRYYFNDTDGLIFVVDSADRERLKEAAVELHNVMDDETMRDVPILVFANKTDLPNAMPTSQLVDGLRMKEFRRNKWFLQASNAITGAGLCEGLERMATMVSEAKRSVQKRLVNSQR